MRRLALLALVATGLAVPLFAAPAASQVRVLRSLPYKRPVGSVMREECAPQTKLPNFLAEASSQVKLVDKLSGNRLELVITDAHAPAGGVVTGPKWLTVEGTLIKGGKEAGSFRAKRQSTFAGFLGTCAILEKCAAAMAGDIATWLENPSPGASLGDAR